MKQTFYIPHWMLIMNSIYLHNLSKKSCFAVKVARKTGMISSYVIFIIQRLKHNDLVNEKQEGRTKELSLTKQGVKIAESCNKLVNLSPKI